MHPFGSRKGHHRATEMICRVNASRYMQFQKGFRVILTNADFDGALVGGAVVEGDIKIRVKDPDYFRRGDVYLRSHDRRLRRWCPRRAP